MKVMCLGPSGSYSEEAAAVLAPGAEISFGRNFPSVVNALRTDSADAIVLPIENSLQGGVVQNMDLLAEERDMFAVSEYILPIRHRLVLRAGAALSDVKRVYSHAQALGQCSVFLSERLPGAQQLPTDSTALSLARVREKGDACIVSEKLALSCDPAEYSVLGEEIADEKKNFTYFFLVKKGDECLRRPSEHVYFVARLLHRPGSLYRLLGIVNSYSLNMTKIESRPIKDTPGEYRFFIEVEGNILSLTMQNAVSDMRRVCQDFKLLGCY